MRTYAPLDDHFDEHPKFAEFNAATMGVMACAITYANRNLSDGRVPKVWPGRRFGTEGTKIARRLVELGIWSVRHDGDFDIVGFLDHNPSRSKVEAIRAKKRTAGELGGAASWKKRSEANGEAPASAFAQPDALASVKASAEPTSLHFTSLHSRSERESASETPARVSGSSSGYVKRDDPLTQSLSSIAEINNVQDIRACWTKFIGHYDTKWLDSIEGAWQGWCVREAGIEKRDREKRRDADSSTRLRTGTVSAPKPAPMSAERAQELLKSGGKA